MLDRTKRLQAILLLAVLIALGASVYTLQAASVQTPIALTPVTPTVFHGDLREIAGGQAVGESRPVSIAAPVTPATQTAPAPLLSFAGLDHAGWGTGWPPDANGDAGPEYYLQAVNTSLAVFRKSDGARLAALRLNNLFSQAPTGTPCDDSNQDEPQVLYDPLADQWLASDVAWSNFVSGTMYECMAVSISGDPLTGGWYFYAWPVESGGLWPAGAALGLWPDGIYMSANVYSTTVNLPFQHVQAWAFNRTELEAGATAHAVTFNLEKFYGGLEVRSLLPSTMHTVTGAPPAGRENLFATIGNSSSIRIWKVHVDWGNLAASSLTGPTNVSIAAFDDGPVTVPELGGNDLDTLSHQLMRHNQYTNFGGAESLWLVHTVGSGGIPNLAQVRWYQLDVSGGTVAGTPLQQSTWAPDSVNRFVPSLALDQDGDMAVGYSVSSGTMYPSIRYAARLSSDALNVLSQSETSLIEGTGFQCCNLAPNTPNTRWGAYSTMSIDPDGCSFWYTDEYYDSQPATLADDHWQTRIGAFRFPACKQHTWLRVTPANGAYGASANLTATLTAGGMAVASRTITFTLNGTNAGSALTGLDGVARLSNVSLSGINAGTYVTGVSATFVDDGAYFGSSGANSLTVVKAGQAITLSGAPAGAMYGTAFTLTATANSGLTVTLAAAGACANAGLVVSMTSGTGLCTLSASQPGNGNFEPAANVTRTTAATKAVALVTLSNLNQTYDGSPKVAGVSTTPGGLSVTLRYDGASTAPVNAGNYGVLASVNDLNYTGSATGTLLIAKASATLTLGNLRQRFDGTPRVVTITTSPPGLNGVSIMYDGSPTAPSAPGTYTVVATLVNPNFQAAGASGTLVVLADDSSRVFLPWVGR